MRQTGVGEEYLLVPSGGFSLGQLIAIKEGINDRLRNNPRLNYIRASAKIKGNSADSDGIRFSAKTPEDAEHILNQARAIALKEQYSKLNLRVEKARVEPVEQSSIKSTHSIEELLAVNKRLNSQVDAMTERSAIAEKQLRDLEEVYEEFVQEKDIKLKEAVSAAKDLTEKLRLAEQKPVKLTSLSLDYLYTQFLIDDLAVIKTINESYKSLNEKLQTAGFSKETIEAMLKQPNLKFEDLKEFEGLIKEYQLAADVIKAAQLAESASPLLKGRIAVDKEKETVRKYEKTRNDFDQAKAESKLVTQTKISVRYVVTKTQDNGASAVEIVVPVECANRGVLEEKIIDSTQKLLKSIPNIKEIKTGVEEGIFCKYILLSDASISEFYFEAIAAIAKNQINGELWNAGITIEPIVKSGLKITKQAPAIDQETTKEQCIIEGVPQEIVSRYNSLCTDLREKTGIQLPQNPRDYMMKSIDEKLLLIPAVLLSVERTGVKREDIIKNVEKLIPELKGQFVPTTNIIDAILKSQIMNKYIGASNAERGIYTLKPQAK